MAQDDVQQDMDQHPTTASEGRCRPAPPSGDAVYGLGMIGAWVYFWRRADTNADRALGVAKGLVWPAFLVYEAFSALSGRPEQ